MATYEAKVRTNYFRVKPECEEDYKKLFDCLCACDLEDFSGEVKGVLYHGFGAYDSISYKLSGEEDGEEYEDYVEMEEFEKRLQPMLADGEAFILMEVGNEKLRYISGYADIVTKDSIEYVSLDEMIRKKAREMLGNEKYDPSLSY